MNALLEGLMKAFGAVVGAIAAIFVYLTSNIKLGLAVLLILLLLVFGSMAIHPPTPQEAANRQSAWNKFWGNPNVAVPVVPKVEPPIASPPSAPPEVPKEKPYVVGQLPCQTSL